jgi:hypothetical protein
LSLYAALYGAAFKDAEVKESKSGSQYGSALITVPNGTDEEGRDLHLFIRLLAFAENVEELAKIKRGDRCYAEGVLSVAIYVSDKGPRPDLTLKAHHVRRTQIGKDRPKREREPDHAGAPVSRPSFAGEVYRREPNKIVGRDDFDELPNWGTQQ